MTRTICRLPRDVRIGTICRCPDCGQYWMLDTFDLSQFGFSTRWRHVGWLAMHTMHRSQLRHLRKAQS